MKYPKQIFVKIPNKTITIDMFQNMTVKNLKNIIYKKTDFPNDLYYLSYGGKILEPSKYLIQYGISKESTIHLNFRYIKQYFPKLNIMTLVDENKRINAEEAAIRSQVPCIVEMKYYVITPSGNHYYGNTDLIRSKLAEESFSLKDLHAIEDHVYAE